MADLQLQAFDLISLLPLKKNRPSAVGQNSVALKQGYHVCHKITKPHWCSCLMILFPKINSGLQKNLKGIRRSSIIGLGEKILRQLYTAIKRLLWFPLR